MNPPNKDPRLEKVDTIVIDFEVFKKALSRNYLGESNTTDRSYVLRLYPPFESEMEAEYYESFQGRHYDNNWDEKPFHISPELLILEGSSSGFRNIVNWPEEWEIKQNLSEEEIEEEGGIEKAMQVGKDMFWGELQTILPDTFNLENVHGVGSYTVDIEWKFNNE